MSSFNGRRGPNVTQFLREMHDNPNFEQSSSDVGFMTDKDLAMFTNTEFFDFETGQNTDYQPQPINQKPSAAASEHTSPAEEPASAATEVDDFSMDFMSENFNFSDFSNSFTTPSLSSFPDGLSNLQPIQPSPQQIYPAPGHHAQGANYGLTPASTPHVGEKRKAESHSTPQPVTFEDQSRVAAEEDKRKRNTAASARFRIKKKQREQALEKSAKEMGEKVTALEARIAQLETENKWLKNIVLEKNGNSDEGLAKLVEEYSKSKASSSKPSAAKPAPKQPSPEFGDNFELSG